MEMVRDACSLKTSLRQSAQFSWVIRKIILVALVLNLILYVVIEAAISLVELISPRVQRSMSDKLAHFFGMMILWCSEKIAGTEYRLMIEDRVKRLSEGVDAHKRSLLVISNHISYPDWIVLLAVANRLAGTTCCGLICFLVKTSILKIPAFGWLTKMRGFIGLKKNFTQDQQSLIDGLNYLQSGAGSKFLLALYPEGTFAKQLSESFSRTQGVQKVEPFKYVLPPRWEELYTILDNWTGPLPDILDLTLWFTSGEIVQTTLAPLLEKDGQGRRIVTLQDPKVKTAKSLDDESRKVPGIEDLIVDTGSLCDPHTLEPSVTGRLSDPEEFKDWLYNLWSRKDRMLEAVDKGELKTTMLSASSEIHHHHSDALMIFILASLSCISFTMVCFLYKLILIVPLILKLIFSLTTIVLALLSTYITLLVIMAVITILSYS
jgi:1-acyl-sn-glycerol-3-phosphate acyltransferase